MDRVIAKKTVKKDHRQLILKGFVSHVLEHGKEPASIFKFAKDLKIKEEEFYNYFTSFDAIKSAIWVVFFEETHRQLEEQEVYKEYAVREKFLSFLFTWVEELKKNRSYLLSLYANKVMTFKNLPADTREFKEKFSDFATELILEGKETQEIASRPLITEKYDEALWLQVGFVFRYWLKDRSPRFEKTDAAIEKSVNFAFDLMGKSALDSFLDLAKFLYQSK
ncbi:MAG: TetR family transcriptional regulator C-terminal domain-containing protein [Bacteroidetes bacterium]|nr:TetR family transcriptional regulator C-terminal domain-containing protein [Bacteroidota bacterium]MDA1268219.1 TetR family transcriptional regulator C-terminal domain-containing protein [Bacteroidota bacterium]